MKRRLIYLAVFGALAACGHNPIPPATVEVRVPVPVPCLAPETVPARPAYRTPILPFDATDFQKIEALILDWLDSRKYEPALEAAVSACSRLPLPSGP